MWTEFLPSWTVVAVALPTLAIAYVVFGIAGFGTALIAAPVLAHFMPVSVLVPLLSLLDCAAAVANGVRLSDKVAKDELLFIVPLMVLGSIAGATLLLVLPSRPMMFALGVFVAGYAVYALVAPPLQGHIARGWVVLFGLVGGVFSAMFGSGGFIYAMYLSRRLADKDAFRATQTTLIGLSTFTRVVVFGLAGVYDWKLLALALLLVPAMVFGTWAGHHITLRLTREQFLRVLYFILIAAGITLVVRAMGLLA
jgi:uncharacterized membrane protein YfcA